MTHNDFAQKLQFAAQSKRKLTKQPLKLALVCSLGDSACSAICSLTTFIRLSGRGLQDRAKAENVDPPRAFAWARRLQWKSQGSPAGLRHAAVGGPDPSQCCGYLVHAEEPASHLPHLDRTGSTASSSSDILPDPLKPFSSHQGRPRDPNHGT